MHNIQTLSPLERCESDLSNRAYGLVALGFMLSHFKPYRVPLDSEDAILSLQSYGTVIFDMSQGLFSDLEALIEAATPNAAKESRNSEKGEENDSTIS